MPNGGNKQWWWRVQRIHLARNGIVWNWCPNLINQFLENHRCSKKQRNLCLQLVHHCFHDVCIGYCIYRLLAHLAIRIGGNNNPRILHASGCWNVVYALLFRADLLLPSPPINQPYLFLQFGNLAIWTQILFYTVIGTHHFIFSAIPWWLQTVAIVGSMGMVIPVIAGTTNFLMTFKGSWHKLSSSYTLPFYLIGIIFYFTGSLQGTAEAFRFTNLIWHFTDFTVAHSHLTMYGIITFMLWGFIYTLVPRLTGKEPKQIAVGAHFWLALIGLMFYSVPLMYGSTLRGLMWMDLKPFMDSVEMMAPYWLWRAIGGSLMWLSHLLFAYNFYVMVKKKVRAQVPKSPIEILKAKEELSKNLNN